jgi:cohesin loading factor subunit SCC2
MRLADRWELCQSNSPFHVRLSSGLIGVKCVHAFALLEKCRKCMEMHCFSANQLTKTVPSYQAEEQATSDYLLKIFRTCIPHMPKTAAKFGQELQSALQPMILKPSTSGGLQVSCACHNPHTHSPSHNFRLFRSRLRACALSSAV